MTSNYRKIAQKNGLFVKTYFDRKEPLTHEFFEKLASVCNEKEVCIYHNAYKGEYLKCNYCCTPVPLAHNEQRLHFVVDFQFYDCPEAVALSITGHLSYALDDGGLLYYLHRGLHQLSNGTSGHAYHLHILPIVRYETEAEMLKLADQFVGLLNAELDELGIGTTQQYYVQE